MFTLKCGYIESSDGDNDNGKLLEFVIELDYKDVYGDPVLMPFFRERNICNLSHYFYAAISERVVNLLYLDSTEKPSARWESEGTTATPKKHVNRHDLAVLVVKLYNAIDLLENHERILEEHRKCVNDATATLKSWSV